MNNIRKVTNDLYWIGASDRRLALFENVLPVPRGVSYNNYLLLDEKTCLFDTSDAAVHQQFFENLAAALGGRKLDYLVIHHMEPDHAAQLEDLLLRYPEVTIVTNNKVVTMIGQFFDLDLEGRVQLVNEGGTLSTGRRTLHFVNAPMVHWPEVMMSYDDCDKVLFSADAFGTFGALNGNIFADEVNFATGWMDEARRYYSNIVGKYGVQVQMALKKAAAFDIQTICPLHGPVWRSDLALFLDKYDKWSRYEPEERAVMVVYGSMYGHTESAADALATMLAERGVRNIAMYDVSRTDVSVLVSEAFRVSHIVVAAPTYNNNVYTPAENFLNELRIHNLQNRTYALVENGTWAAQSGKGMRAIIEQMKDSKVLEPVLSIKSAMKPAQTEQAQALADAIVADLNE